MRMLLVESAEGLGHSEAEALMAAGHEVVTCFEPGSTDDGLCLAWRGRNCPLDVARVDVAVVVRGSDDTGPTPREDGVRCAARARVPVVEVGRSAADPFGRLLAGRADPGEVVATAVRAGEAPLRELELAVLGRVDRPIRNAGVDPSTVSCHAGRRGELLDVRVEVGAEPALSALERQAIAARALDAVRDAGRPRRAEQIHVSVGVRSDGINRKASS